MMNTETISTAHPLRTMILRFDPTKTAPPFETMALESFRELHDRTLENKQHIQQGREKAFPLTLMVEEITELLKRATSKFDHLKVMIPDNPEKETVSGQLKSLLSDLDNLLGECVPQLVDETMSFYGYDDRVFLDDQWRHEVAFSQFGEIFKRYEECAVDMVSFDRDLEDFKGVLSAVKRQEAKYYETMNELVEHYSELNIEIADLFDQVEAFDPTLM